MKRFILRLCLLLTIGTAAAVCTKPIPSHSTQQVNAEKTQTKPKRMFVYKKKLYIDTGEVSTAARCGMMDGQIQKTVSASRTPAKELQSNFGKGYGFQFGSRSNRLEVCIDGTWHIFAYNENNLDGVSIKVKRHTATSAVLTIQNKSNVPVIWGSRFLLERKDYKTGEWHAVPYKHTDFGFNGLAYVTQADASGKWEADWEYIYGALKPGTYRIVKEIGISRGSGQPIYHTLSAKFRVS